MNHHIGVNSKGDRIMFHHHVTIRMHHTDAAGVIYFADVLKLFSDAYEQWMDSLDLPIHQLLQEGEVLIPVVHSSCDIHHPIRLGDRLKVSLHVEEWRNRSYSIAYSLENEEGLCVARGKTIHVTVDPQTRKAIKLPEKLQKIKPTL